MPMNENRIHFMGMPSSPYRNSSHKFFVLGPDLTAEVLTDAGWEVFGPAVPKPFYVSCMVIINETTIFVTGHLPLKIFYIKI
jgi:hypothetical protein